MPVLTPIKLRGGTAAAWTAANPVLANREPGVETDTGKLKVGDGVTAWTALAYAVPDLVSSVNGRAGEVTGLAEAAALTAETNARIAGDALLIPLAQKGAANGVATLGADSKIPGSQLPALAIGETFTVASQAGMLALTAQRGDVAVRTDLDPDGFFLLTTDSPGSLADWVQVTAPGAVVSVNGRAGAVTGLAEDAAVVNLTTNQTVAGVKTFSSPPVVPDGSFPIAKTSGLQTALDGKAAINDLPVNPRSHGAIVDGQSHLVGSVYTTLAAAQINWPLVPDVALDQEIDSVAVQSAINTGRRVDLGDTRRYVNGVLQEGAYVFGGRTVVYDNSRNLVAGKEQPGPHIMGGGENRTIIDNRVANGPCLKIVSTAENEWIVGAILEGFGVICTLPTASKPDNSDAIEIRATWEAHIKNVRVEGMTRDGIKVVSVIGDPDAPVTIHFDLCYIFNNWGWGINATSGPGTSNLSFVQVNGCNIQGNLTGGVKWSGQALTIQNTSITFNSMWQDTDGVGNPLVISAASGSTTVTATAGTFTRLHLHGKRLVHASIPADATIEEILSSSSVRMSVATTAPITNSPATIKGRAGLFIPFEGTNHGDLVWINNVVENNHVRHVEIQSILSCVVIGGHVRNSGGGPAPGAYRTHGAFLFKAPAGATITDVEIKKLRVSVQSQYNDYALFEADGATVSELKADFFPQVFDAAGQVRWRVLNGAHSIQRDARHLSRSWRLANLNVVNGQNDNLVVGEGYMNLRLAGATAAFSITGLTLTATQMGYDGLEVLIMNNTGQAMTLVSDSTASTNGNRLYLPGGTNRVYNGGRQVVVLKYTTSIGGVGGWVLKAVGT